MKMSLEYNIKKYINSISEIKNMHLNAIIGTYSTCKRYELDNDVSEYIQYIDKKPFYVPPSFNDVKTNIKTSSLKPKFILFSAPGATGKSTLAYHIANQFNALYWNLSKVKIGTNSFAGSILAAVGPSRYSEFVGDLNTGNVLLVIDALDEAEIISGRKMINNFIMDISNTLTSHEQATVFLLARTETAQYIASFCTDNDISIVHYEIGFFVEESAKDFIVKSVVGEGKTSKPDIECANAYYDVIKQNITPEECSSFLGYAPVLQAISAHIKNTNNRQKMISDLANQKGCVPIIMRIMDDLLDREQEEKVIPAFKAKCQEAHPEFDDWDRIYSPEEQLVRLIHYILFTDTAYDDYVLDFLPPQLVDEYQSLIDTFLPQHPFIRSNLESSQPIRPIDFTGPAFRDYSLAKIILNESFDEIANVYFEESTSQSYFPSQIFFDCYMKISGNNIHPGHISYVYDSYRSKATAYELPFLQCSEIATSNELSEYYAEFGMTTSKNNSAKRDVLCANIRSEGSPLIFEQLINVSVDTPSLAVIIGQRNIDARITNSSVICKKIFWKTKNISIESYKPEGCLLVAKEGFDGDSTIFDIIRDDNLKISAPNINSYYKLLPHNYDFEDTSDVDITKFIYSLRCILVEFRTHRKDTLAKTADRIEFVTVGSSASKRKVLEYLKECGIIYSANHLYKIDEVVLQKKKINYNALVRMDTEQMIDAYNDFRRWDDA